MTSLSYQLYSSRNHGPMAATLSMLADLGYGQVEGFGGLYPDLAHAEALAADLNAAGLAMTTGHIGIDELEGDPETTVAIAKALGMEAMFVPFLMPEDRPTDAAGWRAFGARLSAAGKPLKAAGIAFGYHNHDFEFLTTPTGEIPMGLILDAAPDLYWENDVAWIVRGGGDPMEWITRYGDRMLATHVKDIAPAGDCEDEDGWSDVGHGTMDWAGLMTACRKTPAKFYVMEHDKPSDDRRFASRSIAAASAY